jgi:hypothetical protein
MFGMQLIIKAAMSDDFWFITVSNFFLKFSPEEKQRDVMNGTKVCVVFLIHVYVGYRVGF